MGRKSKNRRQQRDIPKIASPLLVPRLALIPKSPPLQLIEDRRTHHPLGKDRPARSLKAAHHQLKVPKPKPRVIRGPDNKPMKSAARPKFNPLRPFSSLPATVGFRSPKSVIICLKRKIRKEVIFAKKLTGKGSRKTNRRRNQWSDIRC